MSAEASVSGHDADSAQFSQPVCHNVDEQRYRGLLGSKYVKLNVGGSLHYTTVQTLSKEDSLLRSMCNGGAEVTIDSEGGRFCLLAHVVVLNDVLLFFNVDQIISALPRMGNFGQMWSTFWAGFELPERWLRPTSRGLQRVRWGSEGGSTLSGSRSDSALSKCHAGKKNLLYTPFVNIMFFKHKQTVSCITCFTVQYNLFMCSQLKFNSKKMRSWEFMAYSMLFLVI